MAAPTYAFENGTWNGAEVFAWDESGEGWLIGQASFVSAIGSPPRIRIELQGPNPGQSRFSPSFSDKAEALAWVAKQEAGNR